MSAFEEKLDLQARERMARTRAGDSLPPVPDVPGGGGFLPPDEAARQMGIPITELLRLAGVGVLAHRGRGYGLRIRPAIVSGAVSRGAQREQSLATASRYLELSRTHASRDAPELADRPHVGWADDG